METAIVFQPLPMERVWGGRHLEALYSKHLPPGAKIGESWEIVDRVEAQSVVDHGPFEGKTLNQLWMQHRSEIFGDGLPDSPRFPLLIKLLDARERLSVQVHPPASMAQQLGGEPKTEMWYFLSCDPNANIYAGLKKGYGKAEFENLLKRGEVEEALHEVRVQAGDCMFIPSGRLHAIGAGCVIAEIQQNSDTTYRVFDWNRMGLDGKPRELHIEQSLMSVDFADEEPGLQHPQDETLVSCDLFRTAKWVLDAPRKAAENGRFALFLCVEGVVNCGGEAFPPGQFFLIPANAPSDVTVAPASEQASLLRITLP